ERVGRAVLACAFAHLKLSLDAFRLVEPPRCDPVAHALNITCWMREWTHAIRPFTGHGRSSIEMAASDDHALSNFGCESAERIPPVLWDAGSVFDFLGPKKFCEILDRLPNLHRHLLVIVRARLCMDRMDYESFVLPVHLRVNPADEPSP